MNLKLCEISESISNLSVSIAKSNALITKAGKIDVSLKSFLVSLFKKLLDTHASGSIAVRHQLLDQWLDAHSQSNPSCVIALASFLLHPLLISLSWTTCPFLLFFSSHQKTNLYSSSAELSFSFPSHCITFLIRLLSSILCLTVTSSH